MLKHHAVAIRERKTEGSVIVVAVVVVVVDDDVVAVVVVEIGSSNS